MVKERLEKLIVEINNEYPNIVRRLKLRDLVAMFRIPDSVVYNSDRYKDDTLKRYVDEINSIELSKIKDMFFGV